MKAAVNHNILRWILMPWERIFVRAVGARSIPGGTGAIHWAIRQHHGPLVVLSDGQEITPGAAILEIHLVNAFMHKFIVPENKSLAWASHAAFLADCHALAKAVEHGDMPNFVALYGTTLLNPMARRVGFDLFPAKSTIGNQIITAWQKLLKTAFHSTGHFRHKRPDGKLTVIWMSRKKLITRYGKEDGTLPRSLQLHDD